MMDDTTDFKIGDHVLYLLDGDIGVITDVDHSYGARLGREPYYVEWYIHPQSSGWHSAFHCEHEGRVMVRLGNQDESR